MGIGRRQLLAGVATLGLAEIARPLVLDSAWDEHPAMPGHRWHPLTQSLLDRAQQVGRPPDRSRVERIVVELVGEHGRPLIKWMESVERVFEHLLRYPLDE